MSDDVLFCPGPVGGSPCGAYVRRDRLCDASLSVEEAHAKAWVFADWEWRWWPRGTGIRLRDGSDCGRAR